MKNRRHTIAALGLATLLLSGCASSAASPGQDPAASAPAGTEHTGNHGGSPSPSSSSGGPSAASLMVCGDETMDSLTSILGLEAKPHTVNDWANSTFTCVYHLDEGSLKIQVHEAASQASALEYFKAMQALAADAKTIDGLTNLGFPAYETAGGSAVFQKDSMILDVDASDLPATVGKDKTTRNALAYQLSTTILACWTEHP